MNLNFLNSVTSEFLGRFKRRDLFKGTGLVALTGLFGCKEKTISRTPCITIPTYKSIGVKPFINCSGTITRLSGSLMLPEVKMAMEEASKSYVVIDELMDSVGKRLAELTGAEWGCVTSGCAAALVAGTAACVTHGNTEKMALFPGFPGMKNEVLVQSSHRMVYDRSITMVGMKMIHVDTKEEMGKAINERTAMIFIFGTALDREGISLEDMVSIGKKHGIPVMVDAAAERPDVPNVYIEAGVDLVGYSGGKCMRGPQASGLLLGRKDLVQAAHLNMSPHHAIGRPMKVGKEEIMGLLAAVELWIIGRDHKAERKEWERRFAYINDKITQIPTVKTKVNEPRGRSNVSLRLSISWDEKTVKISRSDMSMQMRDGEPRILGGPSLSAYMMEPGDEIPVAQRIYEILSSAV
ncbi:MAG: aminotransferase class V-fold PLP-dependent enzyme [Candidatus Latescibacteria bacterium]|jgi:D-glucosaminate-6-phosphate ammonia-lyase|nr:aminotransferase class V-fold PLP-dependent enzyme [Candidatus Latescibacterota bacterium]